MGAENCQLPNFGRPVFQGRRQYTQITTIICVFTFEISINILWKCHGSYIRVKKLNWKWHFEKLRTKNLGDLKGYFWGFGCPKNAQTPCWLRLCCKLTSIFDFLWCDSHDLGCHGVRWIFIPWASNDRELILHEISAEIMKNTPNFVY